MSMIDGSTALDIGSLLGGKGRTSVLGRNIRTFNPTNLTYGTLQDPVTFTGDFEIPIVLASTSLATDTSILSRIAATTDFLQIRHAGNDQLYFQTDDGSTNVLTSSHLDGSLHTITPYREGLTIGVKLDGVIVASTLLAAASPVTIGLIGAVYLGSPTQILDGEILSVKFTDKSGAEDVVTNYVLDNDSLITQYARGYIFPSAKYITYSNFIASDIEQFTYNQQHVRWEGVERVVDGGFDTACGVNWICGADWSISGSAAHDTGVSAGELSQNIGMTIGSRYEVHWNPYNISSGTPSVNFGGLAIDTSSVDGSFSAVGAASGASVSFAGAAALWDLDNVSVKRVLEYI